MSADPWEELLKQDHDPWEAALSGAATDPFSGGFVNRPGGPTLEEIDTERAAADQARFQPWSGPEQIPALNNQSAGAALWGTQGDPDADLLDSLAEGASDGTYAAAGGVLSGMGANPRRMLGEQVGNRLALAHERSPVWAGGGQMVGEGAIQMAAAPAALARAPMMAQGAVSGALSGLGNNESDDLESLLESSAEGAGGGAVMGRAFELAGQGARKGLEWGAEKAAPFLRESGLIDRVASSGRPANMMKPLGERDDVIALGQFMEDEGITGLTPTRVASQAEPVAAKYRGQQQQFVDDVGARETPVYVDANDVAGDLYSLANENAGLAPDTNQSITNLARKKATDVLGKAQPLTEPYAPGSTPLMSQGIDVQDDLARNVMEFPDALRQRQAFDAEVNWARDAKQPVHEQVSQTAGDSFRSGLSNALDTQAPELSSQWSGIQDNLGKSIDVLEPSRNKAMSELGSSPLSFSTLMGGAGGGIPGAIAAGAIKTGGRGAMADVQRGGAAALEWGGTQAPKADAFASFGGNTAARETGEREGEVADGARGYLLPQAALQLMQQPGSLGKWEREFFDAANSEDSHAIATLITRLTQTDEDFKRQLLPQLQQMTTREL